MKNGGRPIVGTGQKWLLFALGFGFFMVVLRVSDLGRWADSNNLLRSEFLT